MTPQFSDWVERARGVSVASILHARNIDKGLQGNNGRLQGPCPRCGGTDRFAVDLNKQIFNCRQCGGKGHGSISLVEFLDGTSFVQSVETITGEPPPKKDAPTNGSRKRKRGDFVCAYPYPDEEDHEQYQVCRYANPKSFSQRRPDPLHPGEWIENLNGVRLVPYRLPDLLEPIANENPVFYFEGEKDADRAAKYGLAATTTAMGVTGKTHWNKGVYDNYFRGADLVIVPDQDEHKKGNELADVIANRLSKGIANRVRILTLPVKDFSDWMDNGGTREAFDQMAEAAPEFIPELKQTNGSGGNGNGAAYDFGAAHPQPQPQQQLVPITFPFPIKGEDIPRRAWITPGLLLRRHVSVLVAPPGSGKSLLTLQIGMMCGTDMPWGGWKPRGKIKTLVINAEDDADEMRRRLYAAAMEMQCNMDVLRHHFAFAESPSDIVIAKTDTRTKTVLRTPMVEAIVATIIENGFDVVIIDPFAETFEGDENDNNELKWAAVLWREIARRTNTAVLLVHHTKKYGAEAGSMDSARGATALVGVARIVSTLFTMDEKEAELYEVEDDDRNRYLRFDDAKANVSLVTFGAKWFEKKTFLLPNGTETEPADEVGVLAAWKPKTTYEKLPIQILNNILTAIDYGVVDEAGRPTGDRFVRTRRGRNSNRWAGHVLMAHVAGPEKEAQKLLNKWVKTGLLIEVAEPTATSRGADRPGLKVNNAKRPGTTETFTT